MKKLLFIKKGLLILSAITTIASSNSVLDDSIIASGLKEALKTGATYAVKELGSNSGYLNNALVKIELPKKLATAEGIVRKTGGDKIADDLINSMNKSASIVVLQTPQFFTQEISNMNVDNAKKILAGDDSAATKYFQTKSSCSLHKSITPLVQKSMEENNVVEYYEIFNDYYQKHIGDIAENTCAGTSYKANVKSHALPSANEILDEYITNETINGLFKMIAQKEANIRNNPSEQTSPILKKVFGN